MKYVYSRLQTVAQMNHFARSANWRLSRLEFQTLTIAENQPFEILLPK
jgi:hypothetical protein